MAAAAASTAASRVASAASAASGVVPMSLIVRAIGKNWLGLEYDYTAIISIVSDKLVVTGKSDSTNVVTIGPRPSIVVDPIGKSGAALEKNVATIMESGVPKLKIIDCEGTDSDTKHECKTSVFDFVMWARIYGIRVSGKTYIEILAERERISEEALIMAWRAGMPIAPSGIFNKPEFIAQATRLGIVVPRGGRKHKRKHLRTRRTRRTNKHARGKRTRRHHRK